MALLISPKISHKINTRHQVTEDEVAECFATRSGKFLVDSRENHATDPPTLWFISETYQNRKLKVVFIKTGVDIYLRTAYEPNSEELRIYKKFGQSRD